MGYDRGRMSARWQRLGVVLLAATATIACSSRTGDGVGDTGTGSTTGPTARPPGPCDSPTERIQPSPMGDVPTGWVNCADDTFHRARQRDCFLPAPSENPCVAANQGCMTDAECTGMPHGFCNLRSSGAGDSCECVAGCTSDADCGPDGACLCDGRDTRCVPAACHTDDDCEAGYLCVLGPSGLGCHTGADACRTDAECTDACAPCAYDAGLGSWQCLVEFGLCTQ